MTSVHDQYLLAVETSSGHGSIALVCYREKDGAGVNELLEQAGLSSERTGTALHDEIASLLGRHHLTTADMAGYAVSIGPGSFTAIRVGAAAVKGFAEVHGKPVVAVSTLELIARAAEEVADSVDSAAATPVVWVPILDARRAQVFGAIYERAGEQMKLVGAETVGSLRDLLDRCGSLPAASINNMPRICSPEIGLWADTITAAGFPGSSLVATPNCMADTLARLGIDRLRRGGGVDAAAVDANYVRASDAELFRNI
ncbi:MAG: tRNA (adenosine(37)-N6)-threonylcarbamoyltransferase complex dimerization subunit type 1 TsaB [Acidobacteria bacterium]|nr:tRNA (adenosine(37)-N6)-threonylcarbamoyltransferase complex dimerization subunit type 1 TsaB [Acidobacteriota bacterium]